MERKWKTGYRLIQLHLYPIDNPTQYPYLGFMPNIKFNYLYRDSANYKKFGFVIFANLNNMDLVELDALIRSKLIDETFFYSYEWHLPKLFPDTFDPYIDPTWHEFESVEYTSEPSTALLTAALFAGLV